jgi:7-cyano-7-deazaguanine synthase in queuosine biosynthesis
VIEELAQGIVRHRLVLPDRGNSSILRNAANTVGRALMAIGEAVFEFEKAVKQRPRHALEITIGKHWTEEVLKECEASVKRLLSYVLLSDVDVSIVSPSEETQLELPRVEDIEKKSTVCLFSGGIDSYVGILDVNSRYSGVAAVFCSHLHQSRVVSIVREMNRSVIKPMGIQMYEIPVPGIDPTGYAQTRGFLYILAAASVAATIGSSRIVISECGPTMYQPQFSPSDGVTMTTHPFVVARAKDVIEAITSGSIAIETPFSNLTKAEMIAGCPSPNELASTHSCVSQRLQYHDGTCYGCVVRRLAALAACVPDTTYARDPITDETATSGNLLSLLEFSADLIIDSGTLPSYQTDLIDEFDKWDLFARFALDNFAALHRLRSEGVVLSGPVERELNRVVEKIGGTSQLEERLYYLKMRMNEVSKGVT